MTPPRTPRAIFMVPFAVPLALLATLALLGAGARSADAETRDSKNLNYILEIPVGWSWESWARILPSCVRLDLGGKLSRMWVSNVIRPTGSCW